MDMYRNKLDYTIYGKHISLGVGDIEDNWELVSEEVIEEYIMNKNNLLNKKMIYGKITNGQLEIVTFIDHEDGSRTIGINEDVAYKFGLKEVITPETPNFQYTISYDETETQIFYVYTEIPPVWHDTTQSIQIKLSHIDNARMLKKYPELAVYGGILNCVIESDFVYLYCNSLNNEDRSKLEEFNAIIN